MNIEECYEEMNGSYSDVSKRLPSLNLIEKYIGKFLDDKSFETLCGKIEEDNREEAFRAAHTLKSICANLSFTMLMDSASRLTDELRIEKSSVSDAAREMLEDVKRDYEVTANAIQRYLDKQE